MTQLTDTTTGIEGLYASAPQPLPFAPTLDIRSFLLQREAGNILIYSNAETGSFADLGGVSRHYLNHGHEAMFPAPGLDAPLFVHARERAAVEPAYDVRATFSLRHRLDDDFEVIPTPGHTSGATAYLWDNGSQRLLFTGDTLLLAHGKWVAAVLPTSDRAAYIESLQGLRELEFDVLVPWAASHGEPFVSAVGPDEARRRIGEVVARLRDGADG